MLNTAAPYKSKSKKKISFDAKKMEQPVEEVCEKKRKRRRSVSINESDSDCKSGGAQNFKRSRSVSESSGDDAIKNKRKRNLSESSGDAAVKHKRRRSVSESSEDTVVKHKRRRSVSESSEDTVVKSKHRKEVNISDGNDIELTSKSLDIFSKQKTWVSDKKLSSCNIVATRKGETEKEDIVTEPSVLPTQAEIVVDSVKKKKHRKHRKKKVDEANEISVPPLYVIPK